MRKRWLGEGKSRLLRIEIVDAVAIHRVPMERIRIGIERRRVQRVHLRQRSRCDDAEDQKDGEKVHALGIPERVSC